MQTITILLALISLVSAFAPINDVERNYRSYEEAARQACLYILTGKIDAGPVDKQVPPGFTLEYYTSKTAQPPWIAGIGWKETPTSEPADFIQLTYDPIRKYHFSVQALSADRTRIDYTKTKLAAKFPSNDRAFQGLVDVLNRRRGNDSEYAYSPGGIWDRWRLGRRFLVDISIED